MIANRLSSTVALPDPTKDVYDYFSVIFRQKLINDTTL